MPITSTLHELFPPAADLCDLPVEEVAGLLLEALCQDSEGMEVSNLRLHQLFEAKSLERYAGDRMLAVRNLVAEAWSWLVSEGMLATVPPPVGDGGWHFVTRRGRAVRNRRGLETYRASSILPKMALDPVLRDRVLADFQRGQYEAAVLLAFKEVEIRIRDAAKLPPSSIGVALARSAFHPQKGPLADPGVVDGERQALADFAAGAMGLFKNPTSHRRVPLDPAEAAEMILVANHILRIVDRRAQVLPPQAAGSQNIPKPDG